MKFHNDAFYLSLVHGTCWTTSVLKSAFQLQKVFLKCLFGLVRDLLLVCPTLVLGYINLSLCHQNIKYKKHTILRVISNWKMNFEED